MPILGIIAAFLLVISSHDHGADIPLSPIPDTTIVQASPASLERLFAANPRMDFLTFPEPLERPIRMFDAIPESWSSRTPAQMTEFSGTARPGEYFVFQIGVFAHRAGVNDLAVAAGSLRGVSQRITMPLTCFNTGGVDFRGNAFSKSLNVPSGRVQPLWFGAEVPASAKGRFEAAITMTASNAKPVTVRVLLTVSGTAAINHGLDRGKNLSRLSWLNTKLGSDNNVTRGFRPVKREGTRLKILGRSVDIDTTGLPAQIITFFEPSNQFLTQWGTSMLVAPLQFVVQRTDGAVVRFVPEAVRFDPPTEAGQRWTVVSSAPEGDLRLEGSLEYDGHMEYRLAFTAKAALRLRDIRLIAPLHRERVPYMMGLNHEGGTRPASWEWHWDTTRNQDMLWLGGVNGGLRFNWKAENYVRPLINIYYAYGPLHLPPSWGNGGQGGVKVTESGSTVLMNAYSGPRDLAPGEMLQFDCDLLITPLKLIDTGVRWKDRYFHGGGTVARSKVRMADSVGANIINIHHAEDLYPFINYPYLDENVGALKALVDDAHRHKKRLKLYYTTRELTKNLPEFWALFSMNGEVVYPGPGNACSTIINPNGPNEWLRRNLKERYIPAWLNVIKEGRFAGELDLAVLTTPDSRLNNFYIGGLDWMLGHLGIDGVYVDDSALDRLTLRRARKLIDRYRPEGRIDFHSWNHFNALAGFTSCLNLYMDLLPYIDLVWIGEMRDYDRLPDHWLIEVSGIPYGLTGQMLNNGGNPWRGMVYGITNRPGWAGDPSQLWKFWDAVRIASMRMVGYWDPACPVRSGDDLVKATLYRGKRTSVIAVAAWGKEDRTCTLTVDWKKLGYTPARIRMPAIKGFQEARTLSSLEGLTIPAGKGYLIVLDAR